MTPTREQIRAAREAFNIMVEENALDHQYPNFVSEVRSVLDAALEQNMGASLDDVAGENPAAPGQSPAKPDELREAIRFSRETLVLLNEPRHVAFLPMPRHVVETLIQAAERCAEAEKQLQTNVMFSQLREQSFSEKVGCLGSEIAQLKYNDLEKANARCAELELILSGKTFFDRDEEIKRLSAEIERLKSEIQGWENRSIENQYR